MSEQKTASQIQENNRQKWSDRHPYWYATRWCTLLLLFLCGVRFSTQALNHGMEHAMDQLFFTMLWGVVMGCILIPLGLGAVYAGQGELEDQNK